MSAYKTTNRAGRTGLVTVRSVRRTSVLGEYHDVEIQECKAWGPARRRERPRTFSRSCTGERRSREGERPGRRYGALRPRRDHRHRAAARTECARRAGVERRSRGRKATEEGGGGKECGSKGRSR